MGSTRLNPTHVGWVGLGWTYVMGWIGLNFFLLTMVGWIKKSPQPNLTHAHPYKEYIGPCFINYFGFICSMLFSSICGTDFWMHNQRGY